MFKRFTKTLPSKESTSSTTNIENIAPTRQVPRNTSYPSDHKFPNFLSASQESFTIPPRILNEEEKENRLFPHNSSRAPFDTHSQNYEEQPTQLKEEPLNKPSLAPEKPEMTLGEGVVFKGELKFEQFICINGYYEGSLISQGKISVGSKGKVKADIHLRETIIEGVVEGNITAERIELRGEAQVHGDIIAKHLSVDEGVTIVGQVMVTPNEPAELTEEEQQTG